MAISKAKYQQIQREAKDISLQMAYYLIDKLKNADIEEISTNDEYILDLIFDFCIHFKYTNLSKLQAYHKFFDILYDHNVPQAFKAIKEIKAENDKLIFAKKREDILNVIRTETLSPDVIEQLQEQIEQLKYLEEQVKELNTKELDIFYTFKQYWKF